MRVLIALSALFLSTNALAADPDCVTGVNDTFHVAAEQVEGADVAVVFDWFNESGAAEDACDSNEEVPVISIDSSRFPADQIVCDALLEKMNSQLKLLGLVLEMAAQCHTHPDCTFEDEIAMMESAKVLIDNINDLARELSRQGC